MSLRGADFDTQVLHDVGAIASEEPDQFIGVVQDMGGSGGPLYMWVSIGVAVVAVIVCFIACRCHYNNENKVAQEDDDKAMDQPLIA